MSALQLVVTNAGRAALVNAAANGTAPVVIASVGVSPTALTAQSTTAALPNEVKRISTISGDAVAADTIHVTVRDDTDAVYAVRSIALYLGDGTLFAAYGQAGVIVEKSAQAVMLLAVDVRFADIASTTLTFGNADFINPPATESRAGVARFATEAETRAGTSIALALSPRRAKEAILSWLGFTPVRQGAGANQGTNVVSIGWDGNGLRATVDSTDLGRIGFQSSYADVWRASNDGAGSGLDADLLDGLNATAFLRRDADAWAQSADGRQRFFFHSDGTIFHRIVGSVRFQTAAGADVVKITESGQIETADDVRARRVYAITGATTGTVFFGSSGERYLTHDGTSWTLRGGSELLLNDGANAARVWTSLNDGAGSGLDADQLDGQDGSYYTAIEARLGYTPIRQGRGAYQNTNIVSIGWDGEGLRAQVDSTDLGRIAFLSSLADVWRSTNDGAGSGLDADLLDGFQADAFMRNAADRWIADGEGRRRFLFGSNGSTYLRVTASVRFQNGSDADVLVVDPNGSISASGFVRGTNLHSVTGPRTGALFFGSESSRYLEYDSANWILRGGGDLYIDDGAGHLHRVWTPANDGAGSGLDADLLDGRDASYFTAIAARLGYTPADKAGQIFDGPIGPEDGFRMVFSDGNPGILFTKDARNAVYFNRSLKYYTFYMDGQAVFDVDAAGNARFRGTVSQNVVFT